MIKKYKPYYKYNPNHSQNKQFLTEEINLWKTVMLKNKTKYKNKYEIFLLNSFIANIKGSQNIGSILQRVYGLGYTRSLNISLFFTYFAEAFPFRKAKRTHQRLLGDLVEQENFCLKQPLAKVKKINISFYKSIKCYKGIRHSLYLPVRGQRTHSNAHVARYLGSGTFEYVPKKPSKKTKKLSKYSRRKPFLVEASQSRYQRLLNKNYVEFSKTNPLQFKYLLKKNKLGVFSKIYKDKQKVLKKANKGSKK
jgi:small subunit ribosomal protein S13